jgi:hypothetical protein
MLLVSRVVKWTKLPTSVDLLVVIPSSPLLWLLWKSILLTIWKLPRKVWSILWILQGENILILHILTIVYILSILDLKRLKMRRISNRVSRHRRLIEVYFGYLKPTNSMYDLNVFTFEDNCHKSVIIKIIQKKLLLAVWSTLRLLIPAT